MKRHAALVPLSRDHHHDHRLRREVDDLFAQVDQRPHAVDERRHKRQPRLTRAVVTAQPLEHRGACLRDYPDRPCRDHKRDDDEHSDDDQSNHVILLAMA
jgi:hypothetical protein